MKYTEPWLPFEVQELIVTQLEYLICKYDWYWAILSNYRIRMSKRLVDKPWNWNNLSKHATAEDLPYTEMWDYSQVNITINDIHLVPKHHYTALSRNNNLPIEEIHSILIYPLYKKLN